MNSRRTLTRFAYIALAMFEYFVSLLISGTFLSALCKQIGISDALTGILSSVVSLTCGIQLFSYLIPRPGHSVKKTVLVITLTCQAFFAALYLIPFLPLGTGMKTALFAAFIVSGYLIRNIGAPARYKWLMGFVGADERGRFTANLQFVSLIGGILFSLTAGKLFDHYTALGQTHTALIACMSMLLAAAALNLLMVAISEDAPREETRSEALGFRRMSSMLVSSRPLQKLLLLDLLWNAALYISTPYYGTYLIGDLGYTLTTVSVINTVSSLIRMAILPFSGRFADRNGWIKLMLLCASVTAIAFGLNTLVRPETRWLYVAHSILYAASLAGMGIAMNNLTFDYIAPKDFTLAMGTRNALGGLFGFGISLLGSVIVGAIQADGNRLFGIPVYAQQVLSLLSFLLLIAVVVYLKKAFAKKK